MVPPRAVNVAALIEARSSEIVQLLKILRTKAGAQRAYQVSWLLRVEPLGYNKVTYAAVFC